MRTGWVLGAVAAAGVVVSSFGPWLGSPSHAQAKPEKSAVPSEMQVIDGGFLAIDTPKGWERVEGPGLACFVAKGASVTDASALIYISGAPIGEKESAKNRKEYIQSDIDEFKQRFPDGIVREVEPLELPKTKARVPVVYFESKHQHNAFEQVVYLEEQNRVLTLVLSAKNRQAFEKGLPPFKAFAKSYSGSVTVVSDPK